MITTQDTLQIDTPTIITKEGHKYWHLNGKRHRQNGPAVECSNGYKAWYLNGLKHREDGPAIETGIGEKVYYLNGKLLSEEEFFRLKPNQ